MHLMNQHILISCKFVFTQPETPLIAPFLPPALRDGGVLSSWSGRAAARFAEPISL